MDLCTLLLMDDSNYPCWLVLVPQRNDIKVHARWMPPPQQLSCTDTTELSHELLGVLASQATCAGGHRSERTRSEEALGGGQPCLQGCAEQL